MFEYQIGLLIGSDFFEGILSLTNEQAGCVLKALIENISCAGGKNIKLDDPIAELAYKMISTSAARAKNEYINKMSTLKNNGKYGTMGGRPKKYIKNKPLMEADTTYDSNPEDDYSIDDVTKAYQKISNNYQV